MPSKTPLVLSHASALAYWRQFSRPTEEETCSAEECQQALDGTRGSIHVRELARALDMFPLSTLDRPLDLLTSSRNDRRSTSLATFRCMQTMLPDDSLARLSCKPEDGHMTFDVYASSPELCFIQMACTLSIWELIELGFEMCGNYGNTSKRTGKAQTSITPSYAMESSTVISTPEHIQEFVASCSGTTGSKRARQAAKWLVAQSGSSEETHICILAFLPRSLGGMGAPRPLLNQHIAAPDVVARVLGTRTLTPDLFWPSGRVALEYDGRIWNNARAREEYEKRKCNAYRIMGIEVVSIGRSDLDHPDTVREQFRRINRRCGKRLKEPNSKQRAKQDSFMRWIGARE